MTGRDIGLVLIVMAGWGAHHAIIRIGALEIPPFLLMSLRCFLCAALFAPFARMITGIELKNLLLYALPFKVGHMATLFVALSQVDASLSVLIIKSGMLFSIAIGWVFYQERFGAKTAIGIIIALIGLVLVVFQPHAENNVTILGVVLLIISALCWAIGSARLKYISEINLPTLTAFSYGAALPFVLTATLLLEDNHFEILQNADMLKLGGVLFYQVAFMSLTHFWWKELINRNPIYILSAFTLLTPLFGVFAGITLLDEVLSTTSIIGGLAVLIGLAIITFRRIQRAEKQNI